MPTPSEIQTCINNLSSSSESLDFTLLAAETSNANVGISFSVATVNDLPDLANTSIGVGQIIFVESIGVPVVSTEDKWKGLDGRLLRRDFVANQLWAWGTRAPINSTATICSPVREISSSVDWCQVSVGNSHAAAVKTSGQLWAWGFNNSGRLGDGTLTDRCSPVREICSASDWCGVSAGAGFYHTVAVKTTGQLWAWGCNGQGNLGDGTVTNRCSPVRERCSATDWCQVSAGGSHTAAVKTTGQIWVWGQGACGRLGDGTLTTRCSPVRERCSDTSWCRVSAGTCHTAAIKTTGQIWVWGCNAGGTIGDGTTVTRCSPVREICSATDWCSVSAGYRHTAAIKTSGQIWSWGFNLSIFSAGTGQLGDGTSVSKCSPVREFCSATDWCGVSAGGNHTAAIKTSGQIWSWGYNGFSQLGDGTTTNRCSPVRERCSATDWCSVSAGNCATTAIRAVL